LEEPTGIWVFVVSIWPVVSKVFIVAVIVLLIGFCFWALVRVIQRLKAEIEDYPLFDALHLSVFLAGG